MDESSSVSVPASDAELLNTIRSGDHGAYGMLRARHATAARRLASQLVTGPTAADDVVASAFTTVLDAIGRGGGPTDAFRPYLLTAVRQAASGSDSGSGQIPGDGQIPAVPGDGQQASGPGRPSELAAAGPQDSSLVAAFLSLPERWRAVLWHTQIERAAPSEVAPLLGLDAAGVTGLAGHARDGLRQAYLHLAPADSGGGEADLADVGAALRGTVAPLILGDAAAAYLAGTPGPAGLADSPGSPAFPAAGKTARTGTTAGAAVSWLPGKLRGSSPRQRALAAGAMLAVVGIAAYALTPGPGTGPTTADGHRVAAGALGAPPSPGTPAPSAPRAPSAPSSSAHRAPSAPPASSAPSSSAPPAAPASRPVKPPAAGRSDRTARQRADATPGALPAPAQPARQSPAPALAAAPNPALAARWHGARAGDRNCIAAIGSACVQVPNAAANRTTGFSAIAVARREACRWRVRVPVAGVTSAASIRSARAVQCGRGQQAGPQHASSGGTGASRVGSDASGWPETSWQQTTRQEPAGNVPGWRGTTWRGTTWRRAAWPGQPGRAPRGLSPHGLASPRLGAAGQGTAENAPVAGRQIWSGQCAARPLVSWSAAGTCVRPRAGAVRSLTFRTGK